MTKRPNTLVALGLALFLVGGAIVFFVLRGDGGHPAADRTVPVLVARADLAPGAAGDDVLSAGHVAVRQVAESQRSPDALSTTGALSGQIVTTHIAAGGQVLATDLQAQTLRSGSVKIPKGDQAMAVTVPFTSGVAGYAGPGDHVNIFVSVDAAAAGSGAPAAALSQLLLSNVQVLDVSNEVAPFRSQLASATPAAGPTARATADGSTGLTLLLAVNAQQATQLVFANQFDDLYFSVLPDGHGQDRATGVTYAHGYLNR